MYFVYILKTSGNTLYIGQTSDLDRRLAEHRKKSARSAKYIKYFDSFKLVYTENFADRSSAMHREAQLKKLIHAEKETIISKYRGIVNH